MPNYTTNLNLIKPLQGEQYNVDVFNTNADVIDDFAGRIPPRALTADKLTTGAKINGVNFKGDTDVVTGAGFYYETVTYGAGDLAFIYNQNNGLELHKSLSAGNIGHNPLTSTGYWEKQDLGGSGGRNVGEIIQSSLPLTDAGLHLLDGTRLSGDGIYKEFVDYIAELYTNNPTANYFCTETEWQQSVTTYGSCGKFVYDSTLNTVRLPKVSDILQGTTDVNALGNLVEAGLPVMTSSTAGGHNHDRGDMNITGNAQITMNEDCQGAFVNGGKVGEFMSPQGSSTGQYHGRLYFEAWRTWTGNTSWNGDHTHTITWGANTNTVQPQTIKAFVYIVVATSTKTDIEIDIDNIATDLNNKAETDLSNVNNTGTSLAAGWSMPSARYINLTLGQVGSTYTAPANGYFFLRMFTGNPNEFIGLYQTQSDGVSSEVMCPLANMDTAVYIPVRKGQVIACYYSMTGTVGEFKFVYATGSESEVI